MNILLHGWPLLALSSSHVSEVFTAPAASLGTGASDVAQSVPVRGFQQVSKHENFTSGAPYRSFVICSFSSQRQVPAWTVYATCTGVFGIPLFSSTLTMRNIGWNDFRRGDGRKRQSVRPHIWRDSVHTMNRHAWGPTNRPLPSLANGVVTPDVRRMRKVRKQNINGGGSEGCPPSTADFSALDSMRL